MTINTDSASGCHNLLKIQAIKDKPYPAQLLACPGNLNRLKNYDIYPTNRYKASVTPIEQALKEAQATAAAFLELFTASDRVIVFCHFDADGLAAGVIFGRALGRLGFTDVAVVPSGRGESAFSDAARRRLEVLRPAGLIVTDLGVHRDGVLSGVPTLYVDHHRHEGEPEGATVISGYTQEPIPASAWLAFELMAPLVDIDDLSWIAAVGIMSDLGDKAPWPRLPEVKKRYTAKWLKEAVALVNAARRSSAFDIGTPLDLLMHADGPKELAT